MTDFEAEWQKMLDGGIYEAGRKEFLDRLMATREILFEYNNLPPAATRLQKEILSQLLGSHGENFTFNQPFKCDYGSNIHIGENFFANFNLTILDEARVEIGDNAFIGPNVSIFTACHPLDPESRNSFVEWAEPVKIGDSVWIGGCAVILPGVTIGDNVVVGAGAVVTKDIPSNVAVAGNPARIIKHL